MPGQRRLTSLVFCHPEHKKRAFYHRLFKATRCSRLSVISACGVDLEADQLARNLGLPVDILIPPCHPRIKTLTPLTHQQLGEAIPITKQVAAHLNKPLTNPISLQYIH